MKRLKKKYHLTPKILLGLILISMALIYLITTNMISRTKDGSGINEIGPENTTIPISTNTESPKPVSKTYPSKVLNLNNWKITLPVGSSDKPLEIEQPQLNTYSDQWFMVIPGKDGVRFRAPVNGVTTSGSDYPRSELREMVSSRTKAAWSSKKGIHTMYLEQAITAVPKTKQDVVAGQIHDGDKDIIVIRLNYPNLHIRVDGKNVHTLDSNYTLGEKFTVKFEVKDGHTNIYYNNNSSPDYTFDKNYSDAYFKAGVYTQSNCSKENKASLCNADNYGEVFIYQVDINHE